MRGIPLLTILSMVLGSIVALEFGGAPSAAACSCVASSLADTMNDSALIAKVQVTSVEPGLEPGGARTYTISPVTVWKGDISAAAQLTTHPETTACGLGELRQGDTQIVWANGHNDRYSAGWCAYPMEPWTEVEPALVAAYGPPRQYQQDPPAGPGGPAASGLIAALLACFLWLR